VKCTPEGPYLDMPHESHVTVLTLLQENTENLVYRWTLIDGETTNRLQVCVCVCVCNLQRSVPEVCDWVSQHHMDWGMGKTQLHYIADCDAKGRDNDYAREASSKLNQSFNLALGTMWIGKQGIGLEVRLTQEQLKLWNQQSRVTPHVTLAVAQGHQAKDIEHMIAHMKTASGTTELNRGTTERLN